MERTSKELVDAPLIDSIWEAMKAEAQNGFLSKQKTKKILKSYKPKEILQQVTEEKVGDYKYRDDSDDDSDDETQNRENSKNNNTKLQSYAFALNSTSVAQRIRSLKILHEEILFIAHEFNKTCVFREDSNSDLLKMNYPPPYDASRVVLTNRTTLVSDMANGNHVPRWSLWKKTRSSIQSQFIKDPATDCSMNSITSTSVQLSSYEKSLPIDTNESRNEDKNKEHILKMKLQNIWDICSTNLFRRFCDENESCREFSLKCALDLLQVMDKVEKQIPYLVSALTSRCASVELDSELNVFVSDEATHDLFKRGGVIERQDKVNLLHVSNKPIRIQEKSEEVRLLCCRVFCSLIQTTLRTEHLALLNPYFSDIILALQTYLIDPFPKLKVEVSLLLIQILRIPEWEQGAKHYALAMARSCIPNLRHRNSGVRIAAIGLFEASVCVPNREKVKGAGSEALLDLIGFTDENVVPIASFYEAKHGMTVNSLAELVFDQSSRVRSRCCSMIAYFMVCLPDRYDHHQRLLPYLMTFFNDEVKDIQRMALQAIECCGEQYETEHPEDILEKRQFGVDGDTRCIQRSQLPHPFQERPNLGTRLFVRSNSKRFLTGLLSELCCWISQTRQKSSQLLMIVIVFCEEHLTMELPQTLLLLIKGLILAFEECDLRSKDNLLENYTRIFELMGRFIDPDIYMPLVLSRLGSTTDDDSASFVADLNHSTKTRVAYAFALKYLQQGSSWEGLSPHCTRVINVLTSQKCIGFYIGTTVKIQSIDTLLQIFERIKNELESGQVSPKQKKAIAEALKGKKGAIKSMLIYEGTQEIVPQAKKCLIVMDRLLEMKS